MPVLLSDLQHYVGKSIADICDNGFTNAPNHCAHFVGHALGLQLGMLCGDMTYKHRHTGACIRCDELFNRLPVRGAWGDRPPGRDDGMLIFITPTTNMVGNMMLSGANKHVGIVGAGRVYNYSNSNDQVVVDPDTEHFHQKFKGQYGRNAALYFGVLP